MKYYLFTDDTGLDFVPDVEELEVNADHVVGEFDLPDDWTVARRDGEIIATTPGGHEYFPARGTEEMDAIRSYLRLLEEAEER